jgi:dephospho-CoA kinase
MTPTAQQRPFRPVPPVVIGLLGGIAAGKSTIAGQFGSRGLEVIDADRKAREVVRRAEILAGLTERFGAGILTESGELDRRRLAAVAFADDAARRDLEAITHPAIRASILLDLERALAEGTSVVLDVPLLVEGGLIERCDFVVFVDAPEPVRRERAAARGWDPDELERREQAQDNLFVKRKAADFTIDASRSLEEAETQVTEILARLAKAPDSQQAEP